MLHKATKSDGCGGVFAPYFADHFESILPWNIYNATVSARST
jgi:hypothetical protein